MIQLQLEFIDLSQCPHCKAKISAARRELQHTSGEWNEYVTFKCGAKYHYSPNFRRVILEEFCPEDPEAIMISEYVNRAYVTGCSALSKGFSLVKPPPEASEQMKDSLRECLNSVYATIIEEMLRQLHNKIKRNDHFKLRRII